MNAHSDTDRQRDAPDRQYGRRVEADRSWNVYHVFSGIPAHEDGAVMTGLSRSDATRSMLSLNLRNAERRKAGAAPPIVLHKRAAGQS
ncbi:hypothetical protein EH240_15385 [Mesorhizobium tamadayense]|uniref:Uncharacterized protein n=1 Tax=Mesorhizobium tamadayense TaxID=425306 RepID=A0A3P3FS02_9HYPH|nr:hypothetical protein [Mesorhizobium tamadayense]RRI01401.1 hypothetical protein EH240_15385 [Mesorhizobium tamadayense]